MRNGASLDERDIFTSPLLLDELWDLVKVIPADELFSWRSRSAVGFRTRRGRISDQDLVTQMSKNPRLIRRPIILKNGKAFIGGGNEIMEQVLMGSNR